MSDKQPLVTVIAVCYNQSRFVRETLESIRHQTYRNIQLIIMDDCSTDDSVAVIEKWIEEHQVNCIFVAHTENKGICKTLNECLSYAKGKYISLIATDDIWMEEKLKRQVQEMESLPEDVGVIYSDALQIDESSNVLPESFIEHHRKFLAMPAGDVFPVLLEDNFIPSMTTLIRKSCYVRVGNYDESLCYEDWDMWLRISRHYRFVFSDFVSAKYRIVANSAVRTLLTSDYARHHKTNFQIYSKCLKALAAGTSGSSNHSKIRMIKRRRGEIAQSLYMLNDKERNSYLLKAAIEGPTLKGLFLLAFSVAQMPYSILPKQNGSAA